MAKKRTAKSRRSKRTRKATRARGEEPPRRTAQHEQVYQAARDLIERRLWTRLDDTDWFLVAVPGDREPLVMTILGSAGVSYGLWALRGHGGVALLRRMQDGHPADKMLVYVEGMMLSPERARDVPPTYRRFLRSAGVNPRGDVEVPVLMAKRSNEHLHPPAGRELEVALWFLRGVLAADRQGMLVGGQMRSGEKWATLVLSGSPADPAVALEWRDPPESELKAENRPTWLPDRARLETLPILDQTWQVGLPVVPARIAESPEIIRALLVMEAESHLILATHSMTALRADYAAAEYLTEVFVGNNEAGVEGIPAEIQVTDKSLHELLAPELRRLGVRCQYVDSVPAPLQEAIDSLTQYLGESPDGLASGGEGLDRPLLAGTPGGELRLREPAASDPDLGSDPDPDLGSDSSGLDAPPERPAFAPEHRRWSQIPEEDDIGAWKTVDRQLSIIATKCIPDGLGGDRRLAARFFGDDQAVREVLQDPVLGAVAFSAFSDWLWLDHRPGGRGSTHAEQMLAGEVEGVSLLPAERLLLEALSEAPVSLYVVRTVEPGRSLVLEDLLRGGRLEVRDRTLSETAGVEMAVTARVYPVGGTHFISGIGPPLSPFQIGGAQQLLDDLGLETTPKALRRGAHLFGRIWHWRQHLPEIPFLRTTDGEDVELHHGLFRARDPARAWQTLAAQPEMEPGDDDQVLIWVEPGGEASRPVIIAHLALDGDRIEVETNAAARWERVCARLEGLDGVTLENHESQSVQEALAAFKEAKEAGMGEAEAASGSAEPVDLTDPAIREAICEDLRARQLAWLDELVPALGGVTPRDAVRTAGGRRRVQQMIRAMPDVSLGEGVVPLEPPRDELRRLLGLPQE